MSYKLNQQVKKKHIKQLKKELKRVRKALIKFGVEKIILFGSGARNELNIMSDIDLIIVLKSDKPFIERLTEIYSKVLPTEIDILAYTPDEFQKMGTNNLFIQQITPQKRARQYLNQAKHYN